jgi:hypothetical protein
VVVLGADAFDRAERVLLRTGLTGADAFGGGVLRFVKHDPAAVHRVHGRATATSRRLISTLGAP